MGGYNADLAVEVVKLPQLAAFSGPNRDMPIVFVGGSIQSRGDVSVEVEQLPESCK